MVTKNLYCATLWVQISSKQINNLFFSFSLQLHLWHGNIWQILCDIKLVLNYINMCIFSVQWDIWHMADAVSHSAFSQLANSVLTFNKSQAWGALSFQRGNIHKSTQIFTLMSILHLWCYFATIKRWMHFSCEIYLILIIIIIIISKTDMQSMRCRIGKRLTMAFASQESQNNRKGESFVYCDLMHSQGCNFNNQVRLYITVSVRNCANIPD